MSGEPVTKESETKHCTPDITNQEMQKYWAVDGSQLKPDELSYPCGLLSKYYPLDSFEFMAPTPKDPNKRISISKDSISWKGLKGDKFKSVNKSQEWVNIESETFINWMRPNTWQNVYKAWGRFNEEV